MRKPAQTRRGEKLLELHYDDAIPRDTLLKHQKRLNAEATRTHRELDAGRADDDALAQKLRDALDLLQNAHENYLQADETARQQLNYTLFARILLGPQTDQIRIELNDDYASLTSAPMIGTESEMR